MGQSAAILAIEYLEKKDREIGDEQGLHTRSNKEIETKLIALHARSCAHIAQSRVGILVFQIVIAALVEPLVEIPLKAARRTTYP